MRWERSLRGIIVSHGSQHRTTRARQSVRPHPARGLIGQLCSGQLAKRGYPFNISCHLQ